jgi:hypothetical protein
MKALRGILHRIASLLILMGICLPLASLAFTSGYTFNSGFVHNITHMEIECKENSFLERHFRDITEYRSGKNKAPHHYLPYKYVFAAGVVLVFMGMVIIILEG